MDAAGVHVRTDLAGVGRPVMFADADGEVAVYPLPYLEPNTAGARLPDPDAASDAASESESAGLAGAGGTGPPERGLPPAVGPVDQSADQGPALPSGAAGSAVGGDVPRGHVATLRRAMACVRADLCSRPAARSVVVAHAWVAGAAPSDSERDISVGGVGAVPVDVFDGIDYVALGHLHRPQAPGPRLRYSGSPLPYSFSEAHQVKGSWIVRMDARGNVRADQVAAPVHRRLSVLSGTLDQLLAESAYDEYRDDFLAVVLRDQIRPQEPMTRLRTRFPHALTLEWRPDDALVDGHDTYAARVRGRGDEQIAGAFVEHVSRRPPTAGERELLAAAFDAQRAEAADTRPSHDGDLREEVAAHPLVSPGERSGEAA
jgi:exonuclease SbcD